MKKQKQPKALTKTERNRKIKKKLNKLQTVRAIEKKRTRNDINNIIGIKKFTNILNANKKKIEKKQKRQQKAEIKYKEQLLQGHIDDPNIELNLPKNLPLRKFQSSNQVRDKFDNILKRNVLGEFSNEIIRRDKEKRNKKKNVMVVREKNAMRDDIYLDKDDLKVYQ